MTRAGAVFLLFGVWVGADVSWGQVAPRNEGVELRPEDPTSPAYGETLREREAQRLNEAVEGGGTHLPRFQGEMRERQRPVVQPGVVPRAVATVEEREPEAEPSRARARPLLSLGASEEVADDRVGQFLESLLRSPQVVRVGYGAGGDREGSEEPDNLSALQTASVPRGLRIEPGRGVYGRTLYEVDSDYPGPVVLELLESPFVGAIVTGGFVRRGTRLMVQFNRLSHRGESVAVSGWGVDLDCACFGVGGEVDRHWLERVVVPAALSFMQGFVGALGTAERRVEVVSGDLVYEQSAPTRRQAQYAGAAAAAGAAAGVVNEDAPSSLTVRIPRGTEMVVVFEAVRRGSEGVGAVVGAGADDDG